MLRPDRPFESKTALPDNTFANQLLFGVNSNQVHTVSAMSFYPKTPQKPNQNYLCANTLHQGQCSLCESPDIRDDVSPTAGDKIAPNYPLSCGEATLTSVGGQEILQLGKEKKKNIFN